MRLPCLPEKTSTITISCGRLTTGVTVKPWSAVLYLKGGDGAATYMQTIFRVQSPYTTLDGKMKTSCYVFDFAPDRTLKIVAETAKFSSMAKTKEAKKKENEDDLTQEQRDKQMVSDFIELCPVISMDGGKMSELDVNTIYKKLENVFVDRLVRKGFDDPCLYVQEELNKIDKDIINNIGENGGQAPDETRKDAGKVVDLSHMTPEERAKWEENIRKKKAEAAKKAADKAKKDEAFRKQWESWTDEQREEWLQQEAEKAAKRDLAKQQREEFKKRVSNIRGIALRIPLLMYGGADAGDTKEDITVDNFTRKIKDESWAEFMPKGISKEDFNKIRKCFNATRFEEAGKKYRALTREADFMHVNDRIKQIAEIFSYFRNPDKETVLTPWRVVNMHMSDTLGGYCFFDETFDERTGQLDTPRFVDQGEVTRQLFDNVDFSGEVLTKILEINSKTGLYPLYVTYSLYRRRLEEYVKAECIEIDNVSVQEEQVVWDDIVTDNMFVICNTPMAVGITRRTLFGFRQVEKKANIKNEQLVERASNDQDELIKELKSVGFWKGNTSNKAMNFNAIVGNPPYQLTNESDNQNRNAPIYHKFIQLATSMGTTYVSMITPARWYFNNILLGDFSKNFVNDRRLSYLHDFQEASRIFPNVEIKSGVCYFLWDKNYSGECTIESGYGVETTIAKRFLKSEFDEGFIRFNNALPIIKKVYSKNEPSFSSLVSPQNPFGFNTAVKGSPEKSDNSVIIISKGKNDLNEQYIDRNLVTLHSEWIDQIKILTSKAAEDGVLPGKVISKIYIAESGKCCNGTYMVIGPFGNDMEKCQNVISYIKTKFFRFLVGMKKPTQDIKDKTFSLVPMQDFSKPWTDEELYDKYDLGIFERQYIESMINTMD